MIDEDHDYAHTQQAGVPEGAPSWLLYYHRDVWAVIYAPLHGPWDYATLRYHNGINTVKSCHDIGVIIILGPQS